MATIGQPEGGEDADSTGETGETGETDETDETDETAVRGLYQQMIDAWNAGSGERFAVPFTPYGNLVAFDGVHFRGRDQIATFHQQLFDKWMKGSRLVGDVEEVRFLSPDVALMHAVGNTVARGKTRPAPERASIQTLVAVRGDGEWRLAAFHNTRIRPIGDNGRTFLLWATFDRLWRLLRLRTDPAPAGDGGDSGGDK